MSALLVSLTTAVLVLDQRTFDQFRFWSVGSLTGRPEEVAAQAAPFILVGVLLGIASARVLGALGLATTSPAGSASTSCAGACSS